ncbi:MAG: NAD(P)/FAD-dependent oxidoreductase [Flavisolibacter sp.]
MQLQQQYDVAIIGGGLAGLSCAIELNKRGHSVVLFEKEKYPFHKVCGEYVSFESWNFLEQLGLPLNQMNLPVIDTLLLTAPNGKSFTTQLPLGGFGISRYKLDDELATIARNAGVVILEETKVEQVACNQQFEIGFSSRITTQKNIQAKICCAAYGKRSNLDIKWERDFLNHHDKRLDNYVGIKYHVETDWKPNVIGLHNFKNGYCGISKVEAEKYCLCYMTKAANLKNCGNNIEQLQQTVLMINPHLRTIFSKSRIVQEFPITISQISFHKKTQIENGILMLGDAAGMITPLCGNGMSIALHTGKMAAQLADQFLQGKIAKKELQKEYEKQWQQNFSRRLQSGQILQKFFGSNWLSNSFVQLFKTFPFLAEPIVRMTHGKSF